MADDNVSTKRHEDNADAQLREAARQQAERLAAIARVEPRSRASFCERAADLIHGLQVDTINRSRYRAGAFEKFERAVNALANAVWGLNKAERDYLQKKMDQKLRSIAGVKPGHPAFKLGNITILLAANCLEIVGKEREGTRAIGTFSCSFTIYGAWPKTTGVISTPASERVSTTAPCSGRSRFCARPFPVPPSLGAGRGRPL
jgi:hypothetical protein